MSDQPASDALSEGAQGTEKGPPASPGALQRAWQLLLRRPLVPIFLMACATRLPWIGVATAELDETWTWYFTYLIVEAGQPFLPNLEMGIDAPLYLWINIQVGEIFGLEIVHFRLVQAFFGIGTCLLVAPTLRLLTTGRIAVVTALLCTLNPFLIFYSMQARPYSQLSFFTLVFVLTFVRTRGMRSHRFLVCVATALMVASHYYALLFLAGFYLILIGSHALGRQWQSARAGFLTGFVSLIFVLPLLLALFAGLRLLGNAYWRISGITFPALITEQFLLLGTTLDSSAAVRAVAFLFGSLLVLPILMSATKFKGESPLLWVWLAPMALLILVWMISGADMVFYPRGFIGATPFLLATWLLALEKASGPKTLRRLYTAGFLLLMVFSALPVAQQDEKHAYFRGRSQGLEIVETIRGYRPRSHALVIHDWIIGMFYNYHLGTHAVIPLGMNHRELGASRGDLAAALQQIEELPDWANLLVVTNRVADLTDSQGWVLRSLYSERPLLEELPCSSSEIQGQDILCKAVYLFGEKYPDEELEAQAAGDDSGDVSEER